jgi:restriction system protein
VVSAWADAQRRRQREIEAQQRAWQAAQDEQARAQRTAVRAQVRDQREALRAYQQGRDADAAARTGELDARAAGLGRVLGRVLAAPPFSSAS